MRALRHNLKFLAVAAAVAAAAVTLVSAGMRPASAGVIDEFSPVAPILAASETLALTPQQRSLLTDIDLDFRAAAVQLLNERELLRIDTQRTRGAGAAIPAITADQLRAIEGKTLELKHGSVSPRGW